MADPAAGERPPNDAELLALIDRLEDLLNRSELAEIEVEAAGMGLVLRAPGTLAGAQPAPAAAGAQPDAAGPPAAAAAQEGASRIHAVTAPLTGIYYGSPSPGAEPYLREGGQVAAGQVIGLIEAMKLFNEIKSDVSGRVARICVETGALVKAKQPLIEVEPA